MAQVKRIVTLLCYVFCADGNNGVYDVVSYMVGHDGFEQSGDAIADSSCLMQELTPPDHRCWDYYYFRMHCPQP